MVAIDHIQVSHLEWSFHYASKIRFWYLGSGFDLNVNRENWNFLQVITLEKIRANQRTDIATNADDESSRSSAVAPRSDLDSIQLMQYNRALLSLYITWATNMLHLAMYYCM